MRLATTIAVVLAVLAAALAGVKEQSESCRLQYDIPRLERRRDLLERRLRAAEASVSEQLSPRSLLTDLERRQVAGQAGLPAEAAPPALVVESHEEAR